MVNLAAWIICIVFGIPLLLAGLVLMLGLFVKLLELLAFIIGAESSQNNNLVKNKTPTKSPGTPPQVQTKYRKDKLR